MTFESTTDCKLILEILTHPRIYTHATDDDSPAPEEFRVNVESQVIYLLVRDAEETLGMFVFVPHSRVMWEVHTCLLPTSWGKRAAAAARGAMQWLWDNTDCQRLITNVPSNNRLALRFARSAGMALFGLNEKSFLKDGILRDQYMLGFNRPQEQ